MSSNLPRLHVITDVTLQSRFGHVELAELAAAGGADAVQFREKRPMGFDETCELAMKIRERLPASTALIVNDRLDVALACGAEGVHVGREDPSVAWVRKRVGDKLWIGRTANGFDEATSVFQGGADYLGVGPVFGTGSKANPAPRLGLEELRRIVAAVPIPVIAIGGIGVADVASVLATGCHGIAVLSRVVCAENPRSAATAFRSAIDFYLAERFDGR